MSQENKNKRNANENSTFDENEEKTQNSKSVKVSVISGSSNDENFKENSVILREDQSKVVIKFQKSPVKKSILNEFNENMEDDVSENNNSREDKTNISQKIYDSILVN